MDMAVALAPSWLQGGVCTGRHTLRSVCVAGCWCLTGLLYRLHDP